MLAHTVSFALSGVDGIEVTAEADIHPGLPTFAIVGLPDTAVQESRERVRAALVNSGFEFPLRRITVNLAPADLRKAGPAFDLPLATAILVASGQLPGERLERFAICGELGLDGSVRAVRGALVIADATRRSGGRGLVLPEANAAEASLVDDLEVVGVRSLVELAGFLRGEKDAVRVSFDLRGVLGAKATSQDDLSDVSGHHAVKHALEVAAAGGHNLLMVGPPGSGKSMLARRLPTILPPPTLDEALETTRVHSVAGLLGGEPLVVQRPFRAPHHSISAAGLVGGGVTPSPGEASLAHNGVLFCDELSEFSRTALEALRQPLEEGRVRITRSQRSLSFPARFMLVAATNPCPCGYAGDTRRECQCHPSAIARYVAKLSGPLLDRIDLVLRVEQPTSEELSSKRTGPDSDAVRERVQAARTRQRDRLAAHDLRCNADMSAAQVRRLCRLTGDARSVLFAAHDRIGLSVRGHHRIVRVARTLADLDQSRLIERRHVVQAIAYREFRSAHYLRAA